MAAIAAAAAIAAPAHAEAPMLAGYYETTLQADGGKPRVTRDCLTAQEARTMTIERRLAESTRGACVYTQRQIGGGKFAMAGTCTEAGSKTSFKSSGAYSPTGFSLVLASKVSMGGTPVEVNLKIASRRIAANCPAGAD